MEGISSPIVGDSTISLSDLLHPADNGPANNRISIDEVTGYAGAWRRGEAWPIAPNPIPIEFVTRAGTLWKRGERYVYDASVTNATLRWVSSTEGVSRGLQSFRGLSGSSDKVNSSALSELPHFFVPTESYTVKITVTPAVEVAVYALQDQLPAGWVANGISHNGEFDVAHGQVKWGPFFDNTSRTLSYEVTAPETASGLQTLEGVASFDGANALILGDRQMQAASRLALVKQAAGGRLELQLRGELGAQYGIEYSEDLLRWTVLQAVTNTNGTVVIDEADWTLPQRFYRAAKR